MNREFKFRGWSEAVKKMTYFGDGTGLITSSELRDGETWGVFYKAQGDGCVYLSGYQAFMQFTGLHDETDDDVEVFEGDVIKFRYEDKTYVGLVKFEVGCFIVTNDELPDSYLTLLDISENDGCYCWINGKVIGNLCENPELLKDAGRFAE